MTLSKRLNFIDPKDLKVPDGVEMFRGLIKSKYEPIESQRVGQIMDNFMYKFRRNHGEEIMDYDTRFDKEYHKVTKAAGDLTEIWKAHLSLKKMVLLADKESLVLTAAMGFHTKQAIVKAALNVFPNISVLKCNPKESDRKKNIFFCERKTF